MVALLMAMQLLLVFWSTTTFKHTHTLGNGRVVSHSHIGIATTKASTHAHTQKDFLFLDILLHAPVLEALHVEFSFESNLLTTLCFSLIHGKAEALHFHYSRLRAPPLA
ncbi:MAG: hypothetical protein JW783_16455 [Bacteroidales bacterium]|nr:hypothetical protein [Bacteroidales bacterium]MBN2750732.1 hypothetical protein [Bacteroidales bacterium]